MLEHHNAAMRDPSTQRFLWHIYTNFPLPAHIYLLSALRYHTNDDLAERGWQILSDSSENRAKKDGTHFFFKNKKLSLLHLSLGNLVIKAWNAREAAFQNSPQALQIPRFVSQYRQQLAESKSQKQPATNDSSLSAFKDQPFEGQMNSQFSMSDPNAFGMDPGLDVSMPLGMLPFQFSNVPHGMPNAGWDFWNNVIQAEGSMPGINAVPPPYNYFPH